MILPMDFRLLAVAMARKDLNLSKLVDRIVSLANSATAKHILFIASGLLLSSVTHISQLPLHHS